MIRANVPLLSLLLSLLFCVSSYAQKPFIVEGIVFGYQKQLKIIKKDDDPSFQGPLKGVSISLIKNGVIESTQTNAVGAYSISVPEEGKYRIVFSKDGYSTVSVAVDLGASNTVSKLSNCFIALKKSDKSSHFAGTFKANSNKMKFVPALEDARKSKEDVISANIRLGNNTTLYNNSYKWQPRTKSTPKPKVIVIEKPAEVDTTELEPPKPRLDSIDPQSASVINSLALLLTDELAPEDQERLTALLDSARYLMSDQDTASLAYKLLQKQVSYAERKLKDTEQLVYLQKKEIKSAEQTLTYTRLFVGILIIFLLGLGFFLWQRFKLNKRLTAQNTKIRKINTNIFSSIRYASLIQRNYLQGIDSMRNMFNDSFIYYRPKDIVSGDFYWFGECKGHQVFIVADCTGHGVPGAMLTVLGHSALDNIVHAQGKYKPSEILTQLNSTVRNTFTNRTEDSMPHGMDLTVIAYNPTTRHLMFAGAQNGLYLARQGGLSRFRVLPKSLGTEIKPEEFQDQLIEIEKGDAIFMFSDGYHDQFKGGNREDQEIQLKTF